MTADNFWRTFWMGVGGVVLIGLAVSLSLFFFNIRQGDILAAVGATFDASKDPFQSSLIGASGTYAPPSGHLYQDALPIQFKSWTWEASVDWRSSEEKYKGTYVIKAQFTKPGGTIGMNGPTISTKNTPSITLSVWIDQNVEDLLLNVYDKNGISLGEQSLSWYTASGVLVQNSWQDIIVPLENFTVGSYKDGISGFSISGKYPGVAYIDSVDLSKTSSPHSVWTAPPEAKGAAFNPFATSTPAGLPYTFSPSPESLSHWYTYFGSFGPGKLGEIVMGPSAAQKSSGSMTVFRGGKNWSDYSVDTTLDWGQVSVFSLLARFKDDGNFASCAFSRYGETVQLYHMKGGESNFISQTPALAVPDFEPWKNVNVGMKVKGNRVSCYLRGDEVLGANLVGLPDTGSVGFETWDSNPESAPHLLKAFRVDAMTGE